MSLVLVLLCVGAVNVGETEAAAARLDRALQAALYYVWTNPTTFNALEIQSAATAAYGASSPSLTVSSSTSCSCVTSGYKPASSVSCTGNCSTGQTMASYVKIVLSTTYSVPASYPGLPSSESLSVSGTARYQ